MIWFPSFPQKAKLLAFWGRLSMQILIGLTHNYKRRGEVHLIVLQRLAIRADDQMTPRI